MPTVSSVPRVKLRSSSRRVPRMHAARTLAVADGDPEPNMRLSRAILVMLLLHVVAVGGIFAFSFIKERDANRTSGDQIGLTSGAVEAEDSHLVGKPLSTDAASSPAGGLPDRARVRVHVVRAGETLIHIANEYGVTLEALVAVNGAKTVTNGLHPGQELKLPDKSPEPSTQELDGASSALALIEGRTTKHEIDSASTVPPAKNVHLPTDSGKVYVAGKGETAVVIANKLKVNYADLLKLNQIDDPKKLKPGQKLRVPDATKVHANKN